MQHLDQFWRGVTQTGARSAVFVTNGYFDPAVIKAAESVPLQLIDRAGLDAALGHSTETAQPAPAEVVPAKEPEIPPLTEAAKMEPEVEKPVEEGDPRAPQVSKERPPASPKKGFAAALAARGRPMARAMQRFRDRGNEASQSTEPSDPVEFPVPKGEEKEGSRMDWAKNPGEKRGVSQPVAILAAVGMIIAGFLFVLDKFPAEREQLTAWIQRYIIFPVMNPVDGETATKPFDHKQAPIQVAPPVSLNMVPTTPVEMREAESENPEPEATPVKDQELKQLVIQRIRSLESLKQRLQSERLASEVYLLGRFPKNANINFVEQSGGDLKEAIRLICEIGAMGPRLTPQEQALAEPYLQIVDGQLEQIYPPLVIDEWLETPANLQEIDPKDLESTLQDLERRLFVEESLEARRYAQSIAAVVSAAQSTGIDLVAESGGNLDQLIVNVVTGRKIRDPESPFDGHTFKTPAPPQDLLPEMKKFLKVSSGRVRYYENLPSDVRLESRFQPIDNPLVLQSAVETAEMLIRDTAEQILVNQANRNKSLMPVNGLED